MTDQSTARADRLLAGYAALAIVIHIVEAGIPSPIPGIKPGLANVITLIVALRYGWRAGCWVAMLRILVGSLLVGSFLTPTFLLSLGGGLASLLPLGLGLYWNRHQPGWHLSAVGLGVAASLAHMSGQFTLAYWLFVPHPGLLVLLPVLLSAALVFGAVTGMIAAATLRHLPPAVLAVP